MCLNYKTNWIVLFRDIIIVYPEIQKYIRKLCDQNAEFFNVTATSTYSNQCDLKSFMLKSNDVSNHNELILSLTHLHDETYRCRYYNSQIPANKVPETNEFRNYSSTVTNTCHFVKILCFIAYNGIFRRDTS